MCLRYSQARGNPEAVAVAKRLHLQLDWDIAGLVDASLYSVTAPDKGSCDHIPGAVHMTGGHSSGWGTAARWLEDMVVAHSVEGIQDLEGQESVVSRRQVELEYHEMELATELGVYPSSLAAAAALFALGELGQQTS
jgi:hypothetical protein